MAPLPLMVRVPLSFSVQVTLLPQVPEEDSVVSASSASGEYDDVPKTGEGNMALWLLALSLISFAGCIAFRRSAAKEA